MPNSSMPSSMASTPFFAVPEPMREMQSGLLVLAQPHAGGAQAAQGEVAIIGRRVVAHQRRRFAHGKEIRLGCDAESHHRVGMADDVFGPGDDLDIDAQRQRLEIERRRPGIVAGGLDPGRLGRLDQRRHVLHLEGERARALHVKELGVGADERRYARTKGRIVETGLDAETREKIVAERAHRAIDRIRHQDMVARLDVSQDRRVTGRRTRAEGDTAIAALDRRDRLFDREGGRRAVPALGHLIVAVLVGGLERRHALMDDGRGVVDRRVDDAEILRRIAPGMGEEGVRLLRFAAHGGFRPFVVVVRHLARPATVRQFNSAA